MKLTIGVLCIALLGSSTTAQEPEVDRSLPPYRPVAGMVGVIAGHSSAPMNRLMTMWVAEFERIYPNVRVQLDDADFDTVGSGPAIFGPRLGTIQEPTIGRFKRCFGYPAMEIAVCLRVLAVFVQSNNACGAGLSMHEVDTIFSTHCGNMTWGDLGCGGERAKRPINLYAPRYRTEPLLRRQLDPLFAFKESVTRYSDDADVVTAVGNDALGLGVAPIGCKTEKVRALAIAPMGSTEFVPATADNARSGSYPLTDVFYLVLNHDHEGGFELDPLRREFLRYLLSKDGQRAVVKAGHVALSAEQAEHALAQLGLRPTGEGSWDQMISRLRARRLPATQMTPIEQLAHRAGDQPKDEQLVDLTNALFRTGLTSAVTFATPEKGATIRCRYFGQPKAVLTIDITKGAEATVPIGLYSIWTERDGKATSPTDAWFPVIREKEPIKIYETREGTDRPTDGAVPD
jgi:phosphate transport system substrate-binding protein